MTTPSSSSMKIGQILTYLRFTLKLGNPTMDFACQALY